jgi:hypothetical protein
VAFINMPDFVLNNPGVISLTAGQSQSVTIGAQGLYGFTGVVTDFACTGLPPETTCNFNPGQITANPNASSITTLTVGTTALGQSRNGAVAKLNGWGGGEAMLLLGVCFIGVPLSRRKGRILAALILIALFAILPSCGGGGSGAGGVGVGVTPNPIPTITSLSPSQIAAGSQINGITINGTNFMNSSTITFGGAPASGYIPSATQIVIYPSAGQLSALGQVPVVVTNPGPGGGPSKSANFSILKGTPTGSFTVTVTASSGAITHSVPFTLQVQ